MGTLSTLLVVLLSLFVAKLEDIYKAKKEIAQKVHNNLTMLCTDFKHITDLLYSQNITSMTLVWLYY